MKSVYIHIPFCNHICNYCDFCKVFYNEKMVRDYLESLSNEINNTYKGELLNTIYIGGGTPSSLSISELKYLFDILKVLNKDKLKEFTIECNIESITEKKLKLFKENGINRISIGVESFNNEILKYLGRYHTKEESIEKIKLVKKYFNNINIDIMYAIDGQNLDILDSDLDELIKLDIPHISTYSLIIENNTILKNKGIDYIDEELDYEMYKYINNKLTNNNYIHYEVSNYCKEGYESIHNLTYWNNNEYYGFGCGASGYINSVRYDNTRSITNYIKGNYILEKHLLNEKEKIENEFILGLRKINGINKKEFKDKYSIDIESIKVVNELLGSNKLLSDKKNIYINPEYIYLSNDILIEFID